MAITPLHLRKNVLSLVSMFLLPCLTGCSIAPAPPTETKSSTPQRTEAQSFATVTSVTPALVFAAGHDASVQVNGDNFTTNSVVTVSGIPLSTTFVSTTTLQVTVPSWLINNVGIYGIHVAPFASGTAISGAELMVASEGIVTRTANPQVAQYQLTLPVGASTEIAFGLDQSYGLKTWTQTTAAEGGQIKLLVAGMKAFSTYHLRANVTLSDGTRFNDSDHLFTTGGLDSAHVPLLSVNRPNPGNIGGGIELFDVFQNSGRARAFAADLDGNILWYYDYPPSEGAVYPIRPLPNGDMLLNLSGTEDTVREIDLAGNTVREITLTQIKAALAAKGVDWQVDHIHHEVVGLPNGHWLVLVSIAKTFTDLPHHTGTINVEGDGIVDVDSSNQVVWSWSTFDHLDINRQPMSFPDWTHSNAIAYTPDHNLLVSMRSQHWIVKINYADGAGEGDVLWRLGNGGDFALDNGGAPDWFYGQHFPVVISTGDGQMRLALFDDGNDRPNDSGQPCISGGPINGCFSRGVILDLDEHSFTAHINFESSVTDPSAPPWYSFWGGSVAVLGNGDLEMDFTQPTTQALSKIVEVSRTDKSVLWQMKIVGGSAYRAYRIPSLYPGIQW